MTLLQDLEARLTTALASTLGEAATAAEAAAREAIARVAARPDLSRDTREVVTRALADDGAASPPTDSASGDGAAA